MKKSPLYGERILFDEDWLEYIAKTKYCKYNYLIGSYRSSKTTFNVFSYGTYLNSLDYDALHLCLASSSSVAKALIEDNAGFGLQDFFCEKYERGYYKDLECGYIKNSKGHTQTILYLGGSKSNSFQMFRGISIESIMVEEADLMHENTINEIKGRTFAAINPKYFFSQNPSSDKVPSRKWLSELLENVPDEVNFQRKSIYDNPALSVDRIVEIVSEYDPNSLFFKRYIMGDDASAEGLIYTLSDNNYIDDVNYSRYQDYIIIIDPGKTKSATGMLAMGRNIIEKTLDVVSEFRHKNDLNMTKIYTSSDYAILASNFIKDVSSAMHKWPKLVIIDSFAGDDAYENLRKEFIKERIPVQIKFPIKADGKDGKDPVPTRITRGLDLLLRGKLRFCRKCKNTIDNMLSATYDAKELEKGIETRSDEYTEDGHLDLLDCVDYGFSYYSPQLNFRDWR